MEINRIRAVLAEKCKKNKWLAEQLDKIQSTVSQWCNNERKPSIENPLKTTEVLKADIKELLNSTKNSVH